MINTIPDFSQASLLVAGDVMLDRYWHGPTSRISPEAPVPIVRIRRDETRPGGAANVALNVASLGAAARLLGVVGNDDAARQLRVELNQAGVECLLQEAPGDPTVTKLRVLSRNQQLIRLDFEESLARVGAFDRAGYLDGFKQALRTVKAVILSDYGKGTLTDAAQLIAAARAAGLPVLVDPKGDHWTGYRGATVITPNLAELEAVVGPCPDDGTVADKAGRLVDELELGALLVTRSERGMSLLLPRREPLHLPAQAREVYDVTGAGDTVIAVFGAALASGHDFAHAARLANLAAGIVVGKLGTATVSPAELDRAIRHGHDEDAGILTEDDLLVRVNRARGQGQVIVMTNGCFDLLHVGHVRYLEAARRLGDVLIVAVNDDASVVRLKGQGRPLNPLADRMRVLASLRSVDWVVPFSEDTPERLIGRVLPDLLVKGGDYRPEAIAGYAATTANGGRVVVLDYHHGYSTTAMLTRAQQKN